MNTGDEKPHRQSYGEITVRDSHGRFVTGAPRPTNAGRKKGTPNKLTLNVAERLAALRCDPLEGLAKIARNGSNPVAIRARCYAELAQYVYPRRKAVDCDEEEITHINFVVKVNPRAGTNGSATDPARSRDSKI